MAVSAEAWLRLLIPDGTRKVFLRQQRYVQRVLRHETGVRRSLPGLTVGQAVLILLAYGLDLEPFWMDMRSHNSGTLDISVFCAIFLAATALLLVPLIGWVVSGILIGLIVAGVLAALWRKVFVDSVLSDMQSSY